MEDADTLNFEQLFQANKLLWHLKKDLRLIPYLWDMSDAFSLQSGETEGFIWKQVNMVNPGRVLKNFVQYLKKENQEVLEIFCIFPTRNKLFWERKCLYS